MQLKLNLKRSLIAAALALPMLVSNQSFVPGSSSEALAAEFPSKPIKVIIPFKPGGRTDTVARLIGKKIKEKGWLSQPFVVVNMPGAGGANAARGLFDADPDGHTLIHWHHQMLIASAMGIVDFGPSAFTSIGYTGGGSPIWAVHKDSQFKTLADLVDYLKANPEGLVEAVGIGTIPHFVGAELKDAAGIKTRLVTANSGADRIRLLSGKNADIALFSASEYLKSGKKHMRALVYFGRERLPNMPDVPTATELGYDVVWANPNWWLTAKDAPPENVAILAEALEKAINDPEMIEYFKANTLAPYWTSGSDSMADAVKTLEVLKPIAAGIK